MQKKDRREKKSIKKSIISYFDLCIHSPTRMLLGKLITQNRMKLEGVSTDRKVWERQEKVQAL